MPGPVAMMYEQALDALKGWFNLSALDKSAPLDPSLLNSATAVPAGRCAVINDSGNFVLNRKDGTVTNQTSAMPIFLWNGKYDADVYNVGISPNSPSQDPSNATAIVNWWGISPKGIMSGLVATGGYELQTTEYDSASVTAYKPNALLTATTAGVLTATGVGGAAVLQYTDWVCGVCSFHAQAQAGYLQPATQVAATGPTGVNAHGMSTLSFWTYFLPAAAPR